MRCAVSAVLDIGSEADVTVLATWRGPGFDPYNTHSIKGAASEANDAGGDPYNNGGSRRSARRERGTKPTDLKRLSEWIKRQRELKKKDVKRVLLSDADVVPTAKFTESNRRHLTQRIAWWRRLLDLSAQ